MRCSDGETSVRRRKDLMTQYSIRRPRDALVARRGHQTFTTTVSGGAIGAKHECSSVTAALSNFQDIPSLHYFI
jgi:hypothetical protein